MMRFSGRLASRCGLAAGLATLVLCPVAPVTAAPVTPAPVTAAILAAAAAGAPGDLAPDAAGPDVATLSLSHPAFSVSHIELPARVRMLPAPPRAATRQFRWLGYPSARADELPVRQAAPATPGLLFSHAALGVAELDLPAAGSPAAPIGVAPAGGETLQPQPTRPQPTRSAPAQLGLTALSEAPPPPPPPRPLPIAMIAALVLLPAGLIFGQALWGQPRSVALRHRSGSRHRSR